MTGSQPPPVGSVQSPLRLDYTYVAGAGRSVFLAGLAQRRMLARRCPSCAQVYLPPPEFCSRCLTELEAPFELAGPGVVSTFCVVSFPFPGQVHEPPYVVAYIRIDGADARLMHLLQEVAPGDVRIGMRVEELRGGESRKADNRWVLVHENNNRHIMRMWGHNLKQCLYYEMKRLGVEMYNRTVVTSLLTEGGRQGGRVVGATGWSTVPSCATA